MINYISKLIVGISCCKNIETRFIIYYTPKLLIKRNIKKYFRIKYISIALGFFILTGFSYLQALINNNQIKIDIIIIARQPTKSMGFHEMKKSLSHLLYKQQLLVKK